MSTRYTAVVAALLAALTISAAQAAPKLTDGQVAQRLIADSIANYPGNCPCPYNRARNGSACGRRSAYSKPGGYSPLCYQSDVTPQMIQEYRRRQCE